MRPRPPTWCINCWQAERLRWVNSAEVGCEPNSQGTLQKQPAFSGSPLALEGAASRYNPCIGEDYISQPDNLFRLMAPAQQQMLFDAPFQMSVTALAGTVFLRSSHIDRARREAIVLADRKILRVEHAGAATPLQLMGGG